MTLCHSSISHVKRTGRQRRQLEEQRDTKSRQATMKLVRENRRLLHGWVGLLGTVCSQQSSLYLTVRLCSGDLSAVLMRWAYVRSWAYVLRWANAVDRTLKSTSESANLDILFTAKLYLKDDDLKVLKHDLKATSLLKNVSSLKFGLCPYGRKDQIEQNRGFCSRMPHLFTLVSKSDFRQQRFGYPRPLWFHH